MPLPVIDTRPLFRPLCRDIVGVVGSLAPDDWTGPTAAGTWRVRDVVAHLIDTALRRLSFHRDRMRPPGRPPATDAELIALINQLNAAWVGAGPFPDAAWLHAVLEIAMHALPHAYRAVPTRRGASVGVEITGAAGGAWTVVPRAGGGWDVEPGRHPAPTAAVTLSDDDAWRLLFNALSIDDATARVRIEGDAALAVPLLQTRSVIV